MNKVVFGIDVGGTTIKCGFFSDDGELIEMDSILDIDAEEKQ